MYVYFITAWFIILALAVFIVLTYDLIRGNELHDKTVIGRGPLGIGKKELVVIVGSSPLLIIGIILAILKI